MADGSCSSPRCTTGLSRQPWSAWPSGGWDTKSPSHTSRTATGTRTSTDLTFAGKTYIPAESWHRCKEWSGLFRCSTAGPQQRLPRSLEQAVETASAYDVMYSLQVEDIDPTSELYKLRVRRNRAACAAALALLEAHRPDAVLIPNGLVTELGVFYRAARHLGIRTVTYEFNDQREQIWLAQNDIVMHQNTDDLWRARSGDGLTSSELQKITAFEEARSGGRTYGKGTRAWQDAPAAGGDSQRKRLGLDDRPVVLLATNVLGDSLTLGRNLFASSMAEWIERTVQYFVARPGVQLIVRVHPGERLISGPSMMGVVEQRRAGPSRAHPCHRATRDDEHV